MVMLIERRAQISPVNARLISYSSYSLLANRWLPPFYNTDDAVHGAKRESRILSELQVAQLLRSPQAQPYHRARPMRRPKLEAKYAGSVGIPYYILQGDEYKHATPNSPLRDRREDCGGSPSASKQQRQ